MTFAQIRSMLFVCAIGAGTASGAPPADPDPATAPRERFICTFGGSQRFIDIYRLGSGGSRGGCQVDYTKNGVTKRVWSAGGDYAYCVKRAVRLVTTLSKGNFSCKPQTTEAAGDSAAP